MIQDQGPGKILKEYQKLVRTNLSAFCGLRAKCRNGQNLKIRTMNYMPAFGLDLFDGVNTLYVRFYPLPDGSETFIDKPILRLAEADGDWHTFFKNQFYQHWDGGIAVNVPEDYPWESAREELTVRLRGQQVSRELVIAQAPVMGCAAN